MFSFWPGYSGIARYGRRRFLAIALLFALLLNAFLLANFYWTAFITVSQRNILLAVLVASWILLLSMASYMKRNLDARLNPAEKDELYRQAMLLYLRGQWHETESAIAKILSRNSRDIEVLLLQASLYRHTRRYDEAIVVLDRLEHYDGSEVWLLEIDNERLLIAEAIRELQAPPKEVA